MLHVHMYRNNCTWYKIQKVWKNKQEKEVSFHYPSGQFFFTEAALFSIPCVFLQRNAMPMRVCLQINFSLC